ncbi:MAG: putative lipid II flippase FtsW [Thermoanaerobaculia bacterium]|nr:MAG: putative lipid II flippase FtsW [Thermoanaerobaculia bacterium]MBZ0100598.1 putative lipid II flippase FtsW [Thermoanaerobaculia bacterium]
MAKKLAFDRVLFTAIVLLVMIGLVMVYSASAPMSRAQGRPFNLFLVKQAGAALLGFLAMAVIMHVDYRRLRHAGVVWGLLAGVAALLVLVLFGPELNATRRWLFVGGISVQPAELAKLALVPFVAWQIDRKGELVNSRELLLPVALMTGLLAGLIVLQPDLGSAVLLVATVGTLLFLAGLAWRFLLVGAAVAAPLLWFLVISVPYRRARLFAFLDPEKDPLGAGFQALQSLIAVGSGGLFGLGPGESIQKLYFLPYPHSDFIYAIVAEEFGLIGALAIVVLFSVVLWRGARAGLRAPDPFGRFLAWGFAILIALQAFLNVSVAIALVPTKGIPLPFLSYGGSSMVVSLIACGVLLNVSQHG